jgi:cysteine desulfurase
LDFIAASAHKFHGPKGVGFAIIKKNIPFKPLLHGGDQEHGLRAGTENVHNIVGMEKALQIAYQNLDADQKYIQYLKSNFISQLQSKIPNITFNAESDNPTTAAYHILNVRFPKSIDLFLFKLDLKGIAISGGSACQSGSQKGSHVLKAILSEEEAHKTSARFSFSKFNTIEEINKTVTEISTFFA